MALHPLLLSNLNMAWGGLLADGLYQLGVRLAVVCPGSRSAPLAIGSALHPELEAFTIVDERSAAFFALGQAKATAQPVALICTSGTAAANFLPAVVEAHYRGVPLILLTADRPPELRDCGAGQAIDQQHLYGRYVRWFHEMALPQADLWPYLGRTLQQAVHAACGIHPGPVHLNCPFREPLVPLEDGSAGNVPEALTLSLEPRATALSQGHESAPQWLASGRYLLLAGEDSGGQALAAIVSQTQARVPLLADVLSPWRTAGLPNVIVSYDALLRRDEALPAEGVVVLGYLPTSKVLRQWLARRGLPLLFVRNGPDCPNPLPNAWAQVSPALAATWDWPQGQGGVLEAWQQAEAHYLSQLNEQMAQETALREPKLPWVLGQHLPTQTPVWLASSTPVRDAEWFWPGSDRALTFWANRGANGIDGTIASALGMAHRATLSGVLVVGDLAFLHDQNALLAKSVFQGSLTIILINNHGGGIFQNLPIAKYEPPFDAFFATPQQVDFAALAAAHDLEYYRPESWEALTGLITKLPESGIRIIEVATDRAQDAQWRKQLLQS